MARNFEGLGVSIEVEDDGSEKVVGGISDKFATLWSNMKKAGSMAPMLGKKLAGGLGTMGRKGSRALGGVSMAMGQMIDKAMSPELDHAYSSMYTGFNKSFSTLTAGMNVTTKEMADAKKKIGSAAFGMGEDMDKAASDWVNFKKQGIDLNKVLGTSGLTNTIKGLIKVTSVYEMEGAELSQVMSGLIKGFGFTEEQVGSLADKIVASGKVFNMGKEALQSWPGVLESLNTELADFGKSLNPTEIENLTLSIVQLGGGLKDALGLAPAQAMELSKTMFTTLAGERKNIINMFRGMGGEFGEVAKGLMESGGDVNSIFKMMSEGDPLKFMDTLSEMAKRAKSAGGETGIAFQRLSGVLSEALGPDVAFAMKGNWDKARDSMAKIPNALKGAKGIFKQTADEHWKSSITTGESWDRMTEMMKVKLFGLSNTEVNAWKKQMKSGFKDTFSTVSALAKDDGPLGELTRKMLAVKRVGLTALLPGLSGIAPLLGGIATSALPVLTAMGSMGLSFGSIGKMAFGGGVLWGLFKLLQEGPDKAWESITSFGKGFGAVFDKLPKKTQKKLLLVKKYFLKTFEDLKSGKLLKDITGFFKKIPWEKIFDGVSKVLTTVASTIGKYLAKVDWGSVVKSVVFFIGKAFSAIGGLFFALFSGANEDEAGKKKAEGMATAGFSDILIGAFKAVKTVLLGTMKGLWASIFDADSVGEAAGNLIKISASIITGLLVFSKRFRGVFVKGIKSTMKSAVKTSKGGFKGLATSAKMGMKSIGKAIKTGMKMMGGIGLFMGLMEAMDQVKERTRNIGDIMMDEFVPKTQKAALAGEQAFMGIMKTLDAVLLGMPSMIGAAMGVTEDAFSQFYHDMVAGFESGINGIVSLFSRSWDWIGTAAIGTWAVIVNSFETVKNGILSGLVWLGKQIATTFQSLGRILFYPFEWLGFKLKGWIAGFVEDVIGNAPIFIKELIGKENVKGMEDWAKNTNKEQESFLKGRDFSTAYDEQSKAEATALGGLFNDASRVIGKDQKTADKTLSNVVEGTVIDLNRQTKALGSWSKDAGDYADSAYLAGRETAASSMQLRNAREAGDETVVEEAVAEVVEKKKKRRGKKRSEVAPTPEERVATAPGKDVSWLGPYLKESETRIAKVVTETMNNRPIKVQVQVDSKLDGKKIGSGMAKYERSNGAVTGR